ncbi:MAG: sugar lyase, partial [Planctomycetota bacterium]|nr:sugar lyase [Planctomycetota bacterium]
LRSVVFTSLVTILALDDSPQKVQYLLGWKDWLENAMAVSPRFAGVFKPDGLGFHHYGVYAGAYASCAYEFCALMTWLLSGTAFALSAPSLAVLKRALVTQDVMSNKYDLPYAVMGRMPHPGPRLLSAYAYLAMASEPPDAELAGIFMRLWDPQCQALQPLLRVTLDSAGGQFLCLQTPGRLKLLHDFAARGLPAAAPPQGFWSLPWGALAVHRRDNWLAAVKGWSQYVWDFEMHPASWAKKSEENVYGRYVSYGTLQLLLRGRPVGAIESGWNLDKGWDWCRWPGSTTPHLTLRELYDPKTTWATRFFSAASFVGSVVCQGRNGVFALKLHEHFYDPTFYAYKTYFFFDNEIICLGS